ncbi:MAG: type VI secretion system protein TssA [Pyrinomonadaceae bacterium]
MSDENEKPADAAEDSVNELSPAPVIDLDALLNPISDESPGGESVRYSGVYDEINEARREDDDLNQGQWKTDRKVADYRAVIATAVPVLEKQSKDIQVAAWLSEALVQEHGFVGLRDSLKLMAGLQEKFWDTLFPEIDEGDMEGRANALEWMDQKTAFAIKQAPITQDNGPGYLGWEDSKVFVFPENPESLSVDEQQKVANLKAQAEKEARTTAEQWEKAVAQSRRAFYEVLDVTIEECREAFKALNLVIEKTFDINQAPGLREITNSLDLIKLQTDKLLEQKRQEEPDPEVDESDEATDEEGSSAASGGGVRSASGAINDRKDALKRLAQLASYFRKTEPHSPLSYLINRAVKWGNMPLDDWLQDVIKDAGTLGQIRQTLGFNTEGTDISGPADAPAEPQNTEGDAGGTV